MDKSIMDNPIHEAIKMTDMSFSYGSGEVGSILDRVNLTVKVGEFLGLVGPNGGGKTTLLRLLMGLLSPDTGTIKVFGEPPDKARKHVGYVPQFADVDRNFPITALDVVLMGRLGLTGFLGKYKASDCTIAQGAMEQVGVWELRQQRLGDLSEGQRQRVLIARALASEPKLLVLDEPTASVDFAAEETISALLRRLHGSITIMMVSHDLELLGSHADRLVFVDRQVLPIEKGQVPFTGKLRPCRS